VAVTVVTGSARVNEVLVVIVNGEQSQKTGISPLSSVKQPSGPKPWMVLGQKTTSGAVTSTVAHAVGDDVGGVVDDVGRLVDDVGRLVGATVGCDVGGLVGSPGDVGGLVGGDVV
jgi:hypothetical protein